MVEIITHPELQEQIVEQAIAVAQCGLFDGIFFDWWNEDQRVLKGYRTYEEKLLPYRTTGKLLSAIDSILQRYRTYEEEQRARDSILQRSEQQSDLIF